MLDKTGTLIIRMDEKNRDIFIDPAQEREKNISHSDRGWQEEKPYL
ncbi:MAG TPA: hypothetical protein VI112_05375 [Bacteroidia bacterium]